MNKNNFNIEYHLEKNRFFKECYEKRLWAYVADYMRVHYLYEKGGIYLDIDMEIVKNFSELVEIENMDFFAGFESNGGIGMGLFGVSAESRFLKELVDFYEDEIWKSPLFTMPQITKYILKNKFSCDLSKGEIKDNKNGIYVYPKESFYPFLPGEIFRKEMLTEKTYAIHWWYHSWKGSRPFLFLKTKHLKGIKKYIKKAGIYFQIFRDIFRNKNKINLN
ncbi:MAG: glycosyltransferase [Leptotrichiaceae bacterium]|nr:glycosyltransferase [Leptotrichiaceae bacterium]